MFWIGYGLAAVFAGVIGAPHGFGAALVGAAIGGFGWAFGATWVESRGRR